MPVPFRLCERSEANHAHNCSRKFLISVFYITDWISPLAGLLRCARKDGIGEPIEAVV